MGSALPKCPEYPPCPVCGVPHCGADEYYSLAPEVPRCACSHGPGGAPYGEPLSPCRCCVCRYFFWAPCEQGADGLVVRRFIPCGICGVPWHESSGVLLGSPVPVRACWACAKEALRIAERWTNRRPKPGKPDFYAHNSP